MESIFETSIQIGATVIGIDCISSGLNSRSFDAVALRKYCSGKSVLVELDVASLVAKSFEPGFLLCFVVEHDVYNL